MKFEEKLILIGSNPISYIDEGLASAMPIIFIHGFPFNKWTWQNQLEVLKDKYHVVAYDVQGHGKSGMGSGPFTITQFADDLFLFMDAIKIETAIVCGLSMGGYIALNAIRRQPTRIEALILCDTQCAADTEEGKKKRMDTIASVHEIIQQTFALTSSRCCFVNKKNHSTNTGGKYCQYPEGFGR
jgi:3-oxoadipate enol-lactonase